MMDRTLTYTIIFIVVALYVIFVVGFIAWRKSKNRELRERMASGGFIEASEFLCDWIVTGSGKGGVGYKYNDGPGCYIIQSFDGAPAEEAAESEEVYVGQSVNACQRVRNHLTGHGNGDVYADVRAGRYVRVKIVPCEKGEMNRLEKDLIEAYGATKSYNKTRGGSASRE